MLFKNSPQFLVDHLPIQPGPKNNSNRHVVHFLRDDASQLHTKLAKKRIKCLVWFSAPPVWIKLMKSSMLWSCKWLYGVAHYNLSHFNHVHWTKKLTLQKIKNPLTPETNKKHKKMDAHKTQSIKVAHHSKANSSCRHPKPRPSFATWGFWGSFWSQLNCKLAKEVYVQHLSTRKKCTVPSLKLTFRRWT